MGEGALRSAVRGPTVAVLADVRIVLIILLTWVSAGRVHSVECAVGTLLGAAFCAPFILHFTRLGRLDVTSAVFWVCDALVGLLLLSVGVRAGTVAFSLASAYALCSAALVGICARGLVQTLWLALAAVACVPMVGRWPGPGALLGLVAGCGLLTLLGRHVARQVRSASNLLTEIAQVRSREAALKERMTIARDLHDTVAKSAAGVRMLAESLRDAVDPESPLAPQVSVLFEATAALSQEAREVLNDLRDQGCEDVRLALEQQAQAWGQDHDLLLAVTSEGHPVPVGPSGARQLERILGELLENVGRHARAAHVWVRLRGGRGLRMAVEDDGIGMPDDVLAGRYPSGRYGLIGLRERVEGAGGSVRITRRAPRGTRTEVSMPSVSAEHLNCSEQALQEA